MLLRLAVPSAATGKAGSRRAPRGSTARQVRGACENAPVIDHLSPREMETLEAAAASGESWPIVLRRFFVDGTRFVLGWDQAWSEPEMLAALARDPAGGGRAPSGAIDRAGLRAALERAARFCTEHGLHLLSFEGEGPGEEPLGERRWFLAVG